MRPVDASIIQPRLTQRIAQQGLGLRAGIEFVSLRVPSVDVVLVGEDIVNLNVALVRVVLIVGSVDRCPKAVR